MKKMQGLIVTLLMSVQIFGQTNDSNIHIVGAMHNVMHNNQLSGTIHLDTISNKKHLYGLGPAENLMGELIIVDGIAYHSTVTSDTTMLVEKTYNVSAPFFAYANIKKWEAVVLPDSVRNIKQLENYLLSLNKGQTEPFMFRIAGNVETAQIHVFNLPGGTTVYSPEDAKKGQQIYMLNNMPVEIIGFFSTQHQGIFTHHDTFV
ncbi:MAG: acetolactate decarboxylase, partial [Chitinophagales bacterium]